jgi:hypothetical protein
MKTQNLTLFLISVLLTVFSGCAASKISSKEKGVGDTRTEKVEFYDANTYLIVNYAADSTYGYSSRNPVCVGGINDGDGKAITPTRSYLNALLGPNGEKTKFFRYGSCCAFKTPNGLINDQGLLDHYGMYWEGSDTISIYVNIYDKGNLFIPLGMKSKK